MKIGRIICAFGLIVLCVFGWASVLLGKVSDQNLYEEHSQQALQYEQAGLYQKAIQSYEEVLRVREEEEVRRAMIDCYAAAYAEGVLERGDYEDALEEACAAQPNQAFYWEQLLELLYNSNNFRVAEKTVKELARTQASSEKLSDLVIKIKYAYKSSRSTYQQPIRNEVGYTTVSNTEEWGVIAPDGTRIYDCVYRYVTPYSADSVAAFYMEDYARLLDGDKVVQAKLPLEYAQSRAYGDGLIPVYRDGNWEYMICETGSFLPGSYEEASSFQNGMAAVKKNGNWYFVDTSGAAVNEVRYKDVKLFDSGAYLCDEIMVASDGSYSMYKSNGEKANNFSADDMDLYLGGYVAYRDASGLWGYADKKGNIVIEPRFKQAKSFSGGLAAIYDGTAWGFINTAGDCVIDCQFLDAGYFTDEGVCFVSSSTDEYHMISLRFPGGE